MSSNNDRDPRGRVCKFNNHEARRSFSPCGVAQHPALLSSSPPPSSSSPLGRKDPTDRLLQLLQQRDWEGASFRLQTHPRDAAFVDTKKKHADGRTPLHVACQYRAPRHVLQQLMQAWPVALWTQDTQGWVPLHLSLLYGGSESNTLALIRTGGTAATQIHSVGSASALHLACRHDGVSIPVLRELLIYGPEQLRNPNAAGRFPANLLWKQQQKWKRQQQKRGGHNEFDETAFQQGLWLRLQLLLAAFCGSPLSSSLAPPLQDSIWEDSSFFTLQNVLRFHYECASETDFVGLHLQMCPNSIHRRDPVTGELPLHVAAWYSSATAVQNDLLNRLLQVYPQAASQTDGKGRFPLHVAIRHCATNNRLEALMKAYPAALECPCPDTGLYPFQGASTLDSIYSLLRACPPSLAMAREKQQQEYV